MGAVEGVAKLGKFYLPFAGEVECRVQSEMVSIACTGGATSKMKLNVFTAPTGEVVRVEYAKESALIKFRPRDELERILDVYGEQFYGIGKLPLPRSWESVFQALADHVDLRKATHFDISYVDWREGNYRQNMYICNIYGARGLDGPSDDPDDNNIRVLLNPVEKSLTFGTEL